jgi:uncharacterized protein
LRLWFTQKSQEAARLNWRICQSPALYLAAMTRRNRNKWWQRKVLRAVPRRRHLRGGRLHRMLGERLFDHDLWAFTRRGLAGGLALGLFIGCTPTMGVQIILTGFAAFFLRVNIPVALLATLISNPVTAPVLYPLQYQLGVWLSGAPAPSDLEGFSGALRSFMRYARPLWVGSMVMGVVCAGLGYALGTGIWLGGHAIAVRRKLARMRASHAAREAAGAAPSPVDAVAAERR